MAFAFPNTNNGNNNNNNNESGFSNSNYVLKDEVKSDWYLYRASDKSVFRPYPVYDANGIPCSPIGDADPENQFSIFSEAFAIVPLVVFAGIDGKLQFIDYCPDTSSYAAPGEVLTRTPYSFLISKLREMLPEKDSQSTKSGIPTPPRLAQAQKNIHYAATSLMFRGAMLKAKGKSSTSKHAVDGVMFKSICYVSVKSAISALITELQKPRDPRHPWSPNNSAAEGLFELDGLTIQFDKPGSANSDPYQVMFGYDPAYKNAAMKFFNITQDPMQYHNAVRNLLGANQNISDIFRLLTVGEMVSILKEKYPISWVYYGLKDSPYASLLTPDDREAALRDPEMAPWFGIPTNTPQAAPSYPSSAPQYPGTYVSATNPDYPSVTTTPYPAVNLPVNRPAVADAPTFASPSFQPGTPMGPAASPASLAQQPDAQARMRYWQEKYSNSAATSSEDQLKY